MAEQKQNQETTNVQAMDPLQQQTLAILRGEQAPPTEAIAYFVKRAQECRDEANTLGDQAKQLDARLQELKQGIAQRQGAAFAYADDIKHHLVELEPTKQPEAAKS